MNFNVKEETKKIIDFIRNYYKKQNLKGVVIGISGGKDSAVVAGLFTLALGKENVIGVTLPCHSNESDKNDAKIISDKYGFELINIDLTNSFDSFKLEIKKIGTYSQNQTKNSDINLKPRLRMSALYYIAALYTELKKGIYLVAGTSNKSELYVGYFTKGGDSSHDISVLSDFTVEEVIEIGKYIQVPKEVLYKTPSDGLSGQTDEEKLGVKYSQISAYLNNKNSVEKSIKEKIEKLHKSNKHKFNIPKYKRR